MFLLGALPFVAACFRELPAELLHRGEKKASVVIEDRNGRVLGEVRGEDGTLGYPVGAEDVPVELVWSLVQAEDARFQWHPGFDPVAIVRALWQLVTERRIVSGASTLTQQLARTLVPRSPGWIGKLSEVILAVRIEFSLSKPEILLAYLNHVEFGPNLRGAQAASRAYFARELRSLSLAETAALAAMPRGPSLYEPRRHPGRLRARRDWILGRLERAGLVSRERAERARGEPVRVQERLRVANPRHLVRALGSGRLEPWLDARGHVRAITTTLDAGLQADVEQLVADVGKQLLVHGGSAASVVVVDNASGEVISYVGAPDFFDRRHLGQNDGCLSLRQPGSALKPFVYALAIERLGLSPTTLLFDVEMRFDTPTGPFVPRNYDGKFRGPVRLRQALGMSLNVPAVDVASRVGIGNVLEFLRKLGFESLNRDAEHYGVGLALGDGEVSPIELAGAYSVLARGGTYLPLRFVRSATRGDGTSMPGRASVEERLLSESTAAEITDVLADDTARAGTFGAHGVLEFEFPVAAKTGTSSNHRDNWAVGYTREVTVVAWAGNFDGTPMLVGTSGVVGAAPLMRQVLLRAMAGRSRAPLFPSGRLESVAVCEQSGDLAEPWCVSVAHERVAPHHLPRSRCRIHRQVALDPQSGLLAGPACKDVELRTVEHYPPRLRRWAEAAGRPVVPTEYSPRCKARLPVAEGPWLRVEVPAEGALYAVDPHTARDDQRLVMVATADGSTRAVEFRVDSESSGWVKPPFRFAWPLMEGRHVLTVESDRGEQRSVSFRVE